MSELDDAIKERDALAAVTRRAGRSAGCAVTRWPTAVSVTPNERSRDGRRNTDERSNAVTWSAYEEGYDTADGDIFYTERQSVSRSPNPYPFGSKKAKDWDRGYQARMKGRES